MQGKIIFIEGNPGSGKTTFSRRLSKSLKNQGYHVKHFQEGDLHPIDLAWCAIVDEKKYEDFQHKYPLLKEDMIKHSKRLGKQWIIAYTRVDFRKATKAFYDEMEQYEIYRSKTLKPFKDLHEKLWTSFSQKLKEDTIYIFECVFIQNHINELILKYNLPFKEAYHYFVDLIQPLLPFHPLLFFIKQSDVKASIERVSAERKSPDPDKVAHWIDRVVDYITHMPYAKALSYTDYESVTQYFIDRQNLTIDILKDLNINHHILNLENDYDKIFEDIQEKTLDYIK